MTVVYTIGYEGTDIDRFVDTLMVVGIKLVADVRAVALSRKKGFSKTALRNRLEQAGIAYQHFGALGDPKPGREAARQGKLGEFRSIYNHHLQGSEAQDAMTSLKLTVSQTPSCLLCFERDPTVCHRSIIAQSLKAAGTEVFDLYADSPSPYVDHATKLPRYHTREGVAAT